MPRRHCCLFSAKQNSDCVCRCFIWRFMILRLFAGTTALSLVPSAPNQHVLQLIFLFNRFVCAHRQLKCNRRQSGRRTGADLAASRLPRMIQTSYCYLLRLTIRNLAHWQLNHSPFEPIGSAKQRVIPPQCPFLPTCYKTCLKLTSSHYLQSYANVLLTHFFRKINISRIFVSPKQRSRIHFHNHSKRTFSCHFF